jgi:hypothetical protein
MKRLVLDTSVLLGWWNRCRSQSGHAADAGVERWARELIRLHDTDAIVTPVQIEILGGVTNR